MAEFFSHFLYYSQIILPWFAVGIVLSYFANKSISKKFLKKFSGRLSIKKLFLSQILGMISPLSIMSFLPVASELSVGGVNPGLLLSFFIAERAYDFQSFFIISGLFGIKFAILNALVIFLSLISSAISIRNDVVHFYVKNKSSREPFWSRQMKLLLIVIAGISIGALFEVLVPKQFVTHYAGGRVSGFISAIIVGFSIYLGPIVGNYPVAKAFSGLGMTPLGVFAFLTISPIFNFMVIFLFGAAVGFKKIIKPILVYVSVGMVLTLLFSVWIS